MAAKLNRNVRREGLIFMVVAFGLRAFRPDWWFVPWAVGAGIAVIATVTLRMRGNRWVACVGSGLAFGSVMGVLVYVPAVLFPIR